MSWQDDLKRVDMNQPSDWPAWFIVIISFLGCLILVFLSWYFLLEGQRSSLASSRNTEIELRQSFDVKKGMVVNLPAYKKQMTEIEALLSAMLEKLPDSSEVPSLLVNITEAGARRGLEFVVFDPQSQILETFYASLPILVEVKGSYHQIANFISDLAQMPRIVTVGEMGLSSGDDNRVSASLMLQTYSYLTDGF